MAEYTLTPTQSRSLGDLTPAGDDDICGAELDRGGVCERDPDDCPYHGDGGD